MTEQRTTERRTTAQIIHELRQGVYMPIQQEAADRLVELETELTLACVKRIREESRRLALADTD